MAFADFASNMTKLESYVSQQGYTWRQIQAATTSQWVNHAVAADLTPNELKQFMRMRSSIRNRIIQQKKRAIKVSKATALLAYIRKIGPDIETMPLIKEILANWEDYNVDPNSVN